MYKDKTNRINVAAIAVALVFLLGFGRAANAVTDSPTITIGIVTTGAGLTYAGFNITPSLGNIGSISPTKLADGKTYESWIDLPFGSDVVISGFTSDPGKSWLTSAKCFSVTKTGASSAYSYSNGTATWNWTASFFGFNQVKPKVTCTLIHS